MALSIMRIGDYKESERNWDEIYRQLLEKNLWELYRGKMIEEKKTQDFSLQASLWTLSRLWHIAKEEN